LFTQGYRKEKKKKKFKEVEVTFGKMLPDQFLNWAQIGYECGYEEIYGAEFFHTDQSNGRGYFLTLFPITLPFIVSESLIIKFPSSTICLVSSKKELHMQLSKALR